MEAVPRRALVVSAAIGEGHNAAGRALEQAIGRAWPGCRVQWLDTLASMGPGMGPVARTSYVTQVQRMPWMYEFFFSATSRHRWLLVSTRRCIGSWCGRLMAPQIRAFDPDVIISTYPLGSAGLSWLRQHRRLAMPVGARVPAFFPASLLAVSEPGYHIRLASCRGTGRGQRRARRADSRRRAAGA